MRKTWWAGGAVCVMLGFVVPGRADDQAEMKAIIDKAIKAHGGQEKLNKEKALTMKGKGTFYGMGAGIGYTAEFAVQPPGQSMVRIEAEANGMKFTFIKVVNGDKAWQKTNDQLQELDKEALAEEKEHMYMDSVARLAPLKDKGFQLSPLGQVEIGKRKAVGVNVARKDHRDVKLFFDNENGRLLKREARIKDIEAAREATEEVFYHDYKLVGGVLHAMKIEIKRDGKVYVESEFSEIKPQDKLDDSTFAKP